MDLISVVWEVRPERAASLPRWLGYAVYGAVLRRLAERDAARAGEVHEAEGPSGLTCSTLMGPREGEAVDPGRVYRLRVTAYRPELAPLIDPEGGALWGEGERIELEGVPFRVERVIREGDPWAGWTTYEELIARYGRTPRAWPREVALQFTSPTAFRDGERWNPLPVPEAVFGHLMEKWNRFAPAVLPEALREMVAARVGVARFDLSSRAVRVKEGVRIGCVGQVRYRVLGEDRVITPLSSARWYHRGQIPTEVGPMNRKPNSQNPLCPRCGATHVVKNGSKGGRPRWVCRNCGRSFGPTLGTAMYRLRVTPAEVARTLLVVMRRGSLSAAEEITGHKYETIGRWLRMAAQHAEALTEVLVHDLHLSEVEVDAFGSFVKKSVRRLEIQTPRRAGWARVGDV